jgi:putative addiction module component (TIGR02574 family)
VVAVVARREENVFRRAGPRIDGVDEPKEVNRGITITNEDLRSMSIDQRIDLMEQTWDSIKSEPSGMELTDAFKRDLDRRLQSMKQNPDAGMSWEDVNRRILSRR